MSRIKIYIFERLIKVHTWDFPGGTMNRNPPTNSGTWVWSPVWEDLTCFRATKPVHHSYWSLCASSLCSTREAPRWKPHALQRRASCCLPQPEKVLVQKQRLSTTKKKVHTLREYILLPIEFSQSQMLEFQKVNKTIFSNSFTNWNS